MRLYLSSFKFGNHINKLNELISSGKEAVIVLNARDHKSPEERNKYLDWEIETLSSVGFNAEELDLRNYFGKEKDLENLLNKKQLVWMVRNRSLFCRKAQDTILVLH